MPMAGMLMSKDSLAPRHFILGMGVGVLEIDKPVLKPISSINHNFYKNFLIHIHNVKIKNFSN